MTLAEKNRSLPSSPGVYLMKDSKGKILYVGKAKNLKKRVNSYFQKQDHDVKTAALVKKIVDVEVIIATSEVEALLLERTLIKHHAPPYNILLRDDKEFPFIRIDYREPWPRLQKVRRRSDDGATYVGPFGNAGNLNTTLKTINSIFPLVRCSEYEFKKATRPCTYFHMNLCFGPCVFDNVDRNEYLDILKTCEDILRGKNTGVRKTLQQQMNQAAEAERYEKAARIRDQLAALEGVQQRQVAVTAETEDADVIGFTSLTSHIAFHVLFVRDFAILGGDTFILKQSVDDELALVSGFLMQYYEHRYLPKHLILNVNLPNKAQLLAALNPEAPLATQILVGSSPERKQLLQMASRNAAYSLNESKKLRPHKQIELSQLKDYLGLASEPEIIECIDISNLQYQAIVASLVCFEKGYPSKNRYRKYKIKSLTEHHDDYAAISEVVTRRLERGINEDDLPDLLIIDGGRGQLNAALAAAAAFSDLELPIISLAKARSSYDNDATARHRSFERIYRSDQELPLPLEEGTPLFRLLTQIRDEAHRFAIRYHRQRRSQEATTSELDGIPGVGPTIRKRLLTRFRSIEEMRNATPAQLAHTKGVSTKLANDIAAALKKLKNPGE